MTIKWSRAAVLVEGHTEPLAIYHNDEHDWSAWDILRVPQGSSRFEYQVRYQGVKVGGLQPGLAAAKAVVERSGRDAYDPPRMSGRVQVKYEHMVTTGVVKRDDGGSRVLVSMKTPDGPPVGRNVVLYHGHRYERWIERSKLKEYRRW